ncbi:MAG: glycosyltransferase family 2 protein [Bacteroidetes bacterium]|nr:glycosyltransferase family 2 protein [Bacteroidota bacterium]
MKLSVIIVSYNVKYYLEQCLSSLLRALEGIESEVFVVDNHSDDDSVKMVSSRFPSVYLIANNENLGFSKASNQAIKLSHGEYILILNPDTLIEEDALHKAISFMDKQSDAGGLGVKMINGQGKFLPESKRGLPTPWAAFCKMSNLSKLFPHSRIFNQYQLGFLPENEINKVDVLAGAFMMLKKTILDTIGYLDEDFFMYGEDIDLSYRITQAGFSNYYFPSSRIIHYKGESTRKNSFNYIKMFYGSMLIFARKHFASGNKLLLWLLIMPGIYLVAGATYMYRLYNNLMLKNVHKTKQNTKNKPCIVNSEYRHLYPIQFDKQVLIISDEIEGKKIQELLNLRTAIIITPSTISEYGTLFLNKYIFHRNTNIIIFSSKDLTITTIINMMESLKECSFEHYIAHTDRKIVIRGGCVLEGN